jgi:hypothetical protein
MSTQVAAIETTATVTVYQIPDSPYQLKRPLTLEVERDGESYVVSDPGTGVFHSNPDLGAALGGFFRVFISEFEFLRNNKTELSPPLSSELDRFQQLFHSEPTNASV